MSEIINTIYVIEGMTNGEILTPILKTGEEKCFGYKKKGKIILEISEDWWNKPYKTKEEI